MKKKSEQQTGSALVPVTESLPAQQVNISEDNWNKLNEKFGRDIEERRRHLGGGRNFARVAVLGSVTLASPLIALAPPMALIIALPIGAMYAAGTAEQKRLNNLLANDMECAKQELREKFAEAQVDAYTAQKQQIIDAAEQHLSKGGLLSLEDSAWLGNLTPETLSETTDQLSITAMQIRQMLAHERCNKFKNDGSKTAAKPVTFEGKRLLPDFQEHRSYLLHSLFENDEGIAEDSLPVIVQPELAAPLKEKVGNFKSFVDFINPFSGVSLKREYAQASMPQFKPVEIPGLLPIADFAEALESYESHNPQLDLPAVRGWGGGKRKALPGPRSGI